MPYDIEESKAFVETVIVATEGLRGFDRLAVCR